MTALGDFMNASNRKGGIDWLSETPEPLWKMPNSCLDVGQGHPSRA
jgi:hypothetical protein